MSKRAFRNTILIIGAVATVLVAVIIYLTVTRASEYLEFAVAMGLFAFLLAGSYASVIAGTAGARGSAQEEEEQRRRRRERPGPVSGGGPDADRRS